MQNRNIRREYIKPFIKKNKKLSFADTILMAIRGWLRGNGRYYKLLKKKNKTILWINKRMKKY